MEVLPENDVEYLEMKEYNYELLEHENNLLLVFKGVQFPEVYNPSVADVLIQVRAGYPNTPLDMFWTSPDIKLKSGTWPDRADVHEQVNGKQWQRWSRHTEWRAGIDSLRTFLPAIMKEIGKGI